MKKLEVGKIENINKDEEGVFLFFKKFDLKNISNLYILPGGLKNSNYTFFTFITNNDQELQFYYKKNQMLYTIKIWDEGKQLGKVIVNEDERNEQKEEWMNLIWEQIADYFNLRIRLMFINETTPWTWNTKFTY